ncbi:MAG: hypothetical protein EBV79_10540, partial [Betaproteobacteria bacterium]|nr:hypothetical protein [Betaproteobacteria bacterium]
GQLNAINFDVTRERLQYKIDKDGKILQDWTNTPLGIELDVGASGLKWGDGKYTISARLVDKAGNFKPMSAGSALGAGNGYINFVLDTTKPLALAAPTLQADTTNTLPANASDKVTSNFLLADPTPKTETGAILQYSVTAPGNAVATVTWYSTYLDAMGAANGLSGAALNSWVELAGSAGTLAQAAAQLKEGVYVVSRRQIDKAGNESPQASLSFKLNTMASSISAVLSNDTSAGQKVSSDVTVGVSGVDGTAGTDVVLTYTLTRYADATRAANKQIGSPIITNVTPSNAYKPPTADGFYTLVVRSVNKAGLVSTSTLNFELDTTNPLAPGAITLDASSNSARQAFDSDTAGTTDSTSTSTAPTFNVVLPSGARIGDRLKLFLNGDVTKPWGEVVLTADHLKIGTAPVPLNPLLVSFLRLI